MCYICGMGIATDALAAIDLAYRNLQDENDRLLQSNQLLDKALRDQSEKLPKTRFGINVHLGESAYQDVKRFISDLKALGIKYIRSDFDHVDGKMKIHDKWVNEFKPALDEIGVHVRPMVYFRGDVGKSFTNFANLYPEFDEIEVGNEIALMSIKGGNGTIASEYDEKLPDVLNKAQAGYMALMNINRPIKIITSLTWTHTYPFDVLRSRGVNFDFSLHVYTDGWANTAKLKAANLWEVVRRKYGDRVFEIGEGNFMPKQDGSNYTDELQLTRLTDYINNTWGSGIPLYVFEMYDRDIKGREGQLGIIRKDGSWKPSANYIAGLKK